MINNKRKSQYRLLPQADLILQNPAWRYWGAGYGCAIIFSMNMMRKHKLFSSPPLTHYPKFSCHLSEDSCTRCHLPIGKRTKKRIK